MRVLQCGARVACLILLTTEIVLALPGEAPAAASGTVRRHLAREADPCEAVLADPRGSYRRLLHEARAWAEGTTQDREDARAYLTGMSEAEPAGAAQVHNITPDRVIAPAFCHIYLGGDPEDGARMLWALLDAHDGLKIDGASLWGRWLSGYQLSEAMAASWLLEEQVGRLGVAPPAWMDRIPALIDRAATDFAVTSENVVDTARGELLIDTRFEDNALTFVGWAFVAILHARQSDARGARLAADTAAAFFDHAVSLQHVCWIPDGLSEADLSAQDCRQDSAALVTAEAAYRADPSAVQPPRLAIFNHSREHPHYGIGILNNMTLALALLHRYGLNDSRLTDLQRALISGIYRWGQVHATSDGSWEKVNSPGNGCLVTMRDQGGSRVQTDRNGAAVRAYCGEDGLFGGYAARQVPVRRLLTLTGLDIGGPPSLPEGAFSFSTFAAETDVKDTASGERFPFFPAVWANPPLFALDNGRQVFYGVMNDRLLDHLDLLGEPDPASR